ncbi:MAG: O-antigen ligase family protein [Myxococcaceae bacterium]
MTTAIAVIAGNDNPVIGLAPILGAALLFAVWTLPLRHTVTALLFLLLMVDYTPENPFHGFWSTPLRPIAVLLLSNLNQVTGVGALRAPLLVIATVFLLGLGVYRRAIKNDVDNPRVPAASCLTQALLLSLESIVAWWAWGAARGGNPREALWQIQQLLAVPLIAFLFHAAYRGPSDFKILGRVILISASWKAATAVFFVYGIARRQGLEIEWATSHSDTFLFVTAMVILTARWLEEPTGRVFIRVTPVIVLVGLGVIANDRRLAYVALAISLGFVFLLMPRNRLKVLFLRTLGLMSPLFFVYAVVGWQVKSVVFLPVQVLRSLVEGQGGPPGQPDYRDLENFNVIATWMKNGVLGSGFGHEFELLLEMPDISMAMPTWKFHPHNSLLWLWSNVGLIGFSLITLYLGVTAMLAGRAYRKAARPIDRTAALAAISVVVVYLVQSFGDMGTTSWLGAFFVGLAATMTSKLAVAVGAWPAQRRVITPSVAPTLAAVEGGAP